MEKYSTPDLAAQKEHYHPWAEGAEPWKGSCSEKVI